MALQQSTQKEKPAALEFGVDTVYERKNIVFKTDKADETGQKREYWEYDETTYTYPEYTVKLHGQQEDIMLAQVELANLLTGGN